MITYRDILVVIFIGFFALVAIYVVGWFLMQIDIFSEEKKEVDEQ